MPSIRFPIRILLALALLAPAVSARTLLVLPVSGEGISPADLSTVTRLFRSALEERHPEAVSGGSPCEERACALEAARGASADEVVYGSLHKLGSRWIFTAAVVKADGTGAFSQRLTALSIEDMEALTVRMADALVRRRGTEQVASLDNITGKESDKEPDRRRSLYNGGLALGYLFPVGPNDTYSGSDQVMRATWLNSWEFRNDLTLGADIVWAVMESFGADLNLRYQFSRNDISPFIGGGVGLHYTSGPGEIPTAPALNAQGGLMLFRTYDVNVMLRGQYQVIFNEHIDHGPAIDVGVSFRSKDKSGGGGSSGDGIGFWGYTGLGLLFLMIVGAAN